MRGRTSPPRWRPHPWAAGLATALALLTAGCADDRPPAGTGSTPAPPAVASPTGPNDAEAALPPALPVPTDDAAAAAMNVATAAMGAFARPGVDAGTWFAELAPLLTPAAQAAYTGTDPSRVPAAAVTGPPRAGDSPSAYLATVTVPTDVGDYTVLLVREGAGTPWLVERLTPPADLPTA